jgi:N utilization substance protein A
MKLINGLSTLSRLSDLRQQRLFMNAPRDMLVEKADLEEETVDSVLNVLNAEFEK